MPCLQIGFLYRRINVLASPFDSRVVLKCSRSELHVFLGIWNFYTEKEQEQWSKGSFRFRKKIREKIDKDGGATLEAGCDRSLRLCTHCCHEININAQFIVSHAAEEYRNKIQAVTYHSGVIHPCEFLQFAKGRHVNGK